MLTHAKEWLKQANKLMTDDNCLIRDANIHNLFQAKSGGALAITMNTTYGKQKSRIASQAYEKDESWLLTNFDDKKIGYIMFILLRFTISLLLFFAEPRAYDFIDVIF